MQVIKKVTNDDTGRVATSDDGRYRIKVLEVIGYDDGMVSVKAEDLDGSGIFYGFALIGGSVLMYWEDNSTCEDYPEMSLDISAAVHASRTVNQVRGVKDVMIYLTSETGECADWLANPDRQKEDLMGECADVIICALDLALIHKRETSDLDGQELADEVVSHLNDLLRAKAEKWVAKHAN